MLRPCKTSSYQLLYTKVGCNSQLLQPSHNFQILLLLKDPNDNRHQ